jgi:hypothetical protein
MVLQHGVGGNICLPKVGKKSQTHLLHVRGWQRTWLPNLLGGMNM